MDVNHKMLFLSYCHENQGEVARLRDDLLKMGENVWWDQDIKGGEDWQSVIRSVLKRSYAVVLCLSKESERKFRSGIYPELRDAIEIYRQLKPGSIFLIPVRLSECELPYIEIDSNLTLDRLQYIDLFPDSQRAAGLDKLLEAIRSVPYHPWLAHRHSLRQCRWASQGYLRSRPRHLRFPSDGLSLQRVRQSCI
jgi:TIR domain